MSPFENLQQSSVKGIMKLCLGWIVGAGCGTFISKLEENFWDIDIKKVGLSHSRQNVCMP